MHKKPLSNRQKAARAAAKRKKAVKTAVILAVAAILLATGTFLLVRNYDAIRARLENRGRIELSPLGEEELLDEKNGTHYLLAPPEFEPASRGKAAAWCPALDGRLYYAIGDEDTALYLADEDTGTGTRMYHASTVTLPTLFEMNVDRIQVCNSDYAYLVEIANITDPALIAETLDLFANGEQKNHPFEWNFRLDLKFLSDEWPALAYNLTYYDTDDGAYLMDRKSLRSVYIGTLLRDAIHYR